jgi:hypothetical protein
MGLREIVYPMHGSLGRLPNLAPLVLLVKKQHIDEEECGALVE